MNSRQDDFESRCKERHGILPNLCAAGKKIRLPMKVAANGLFVYRGCHNPIEFTGEGCRARLLEISKRASAGSGVLFSPFDRGGIRPQVAEEEDRIAG